MASISSATCPFRSNLMARILIVEARFYGHLNDMLIAGAKAAITSAGHDAEVITVPGALEVPGAIALAAENGRYGGFVAIGVVIRGETYHFRSEEHTSELQSIMPISYAVFCL